MIYASLTYSAKYGPYSMDHKSVNDFERWCFNEGVIWGHLVVIETGRHVASFLNGKITVL